MFLTVVLVVKLRLTKMRAKPCSVIVGVIVLLLAAHLSPSHADQAISNATEFCRATLGSQSIRLVVPFAAGGGKDVLARQIATAFDEQNGIKVRVVNLPGAMGTIAAQSLMNSEPNTISVGMVDPRMLLSGVMLEMKAPPLNQFTALLILINEPAVWIVRNDAAVRLDQNQRVLASSSEYVWRLERPARRLNRNIVSIKGYRGSSDVWAALSRGELDVMALTASAAQRYLARDESFASVWMTFAPERVPEFPEAKTFGERLQELGSIPAQRQPSVTSSEQDSMYQLTRSLITLAVDDNLPADLKQCLSDSFYRVTTVPTFQKRMEALGVPIQPSSVMDSNVFLQLTAAIDQLAN